MHKIEQLSKYIISQIAAGEVIYNPSSIVKELIENSIDAMSTEISVYIEKGGKQLISVVDNGLGMDKDDLKHSTHRYYTSKMQDLYDVHTLGFRGEALFSISQSALLKIETKTQDSSYGWLITASADGVSEVEIVPLSAGTTVTVINLFKYLPVRLKFLKSDIHEKKSIEDLIARFAACYHDITFKLFHNDKLVLNYRKSTKEKRVYQIMHDSFTENSKVLNYTEDDFSITGFVSTTGYHLSNSFNQYVFVNGRYIKDKYIAAVINSVYRDHIPRGRYSSYVIFLSIANEYIDLHVHPAKTEIRFNNFHRIKNLLTVVLSDLIERFNQSINHNNDTFMKFFQSGDSSSEKPSELNNKDKLFDSKFITDNNFDNNISNDKIDNNISNDKIDNSNINDILHSEIDKDSTNSINDDNDQYNTFLNYKNTLNNSKAKARFDEDNHVVNSDDKFHQLKSAKKHNDFKDVSGGKYNMSDMFDRKDTFNDFMLKDNKDFNLNEDSNIEGYDFQNRDNVQNKKINSKGSITKNIFSDDLNANKIDDISKGKNSAVKKDQFKRSAFDGFDSDIDGEQFQKLQLGKPIKQIFNTFIITETNDELILIDQHAAHERIVYESMKKSFNDNKFDVIKLLLPVEISFNYDFEKQALNRCLSLGFEIVKTKQNLYNVIGYPSFILKKNIKNIVLDILHELASDADNFSKSIIERKFADIACKASIKAGDLLDMYEMRFLIKQMENNPFSAQCNHGRPTYIKISNDKLRRIFERT